MAQLGQSEKITYISKNLVSGLTNIKAYVMKPNGTFVGPFLLAENVHAKFKGFYHFLFDTNKTIDEFGSYVGVIESEIEGHRASFKIQYDEISIGEINGILDGVVDVIRQLNRVDLEVGIEELDEIEVYMEAN